MNCIIKFMYLCFKRLSSILTLSLLLFIFSYPISLNAQECIGSYFLTSQAEVDVFNCTTVTGDLDIGLEEDIDDYNPDHIPKISNITNLNGLSELTSVGGHLLIWNNDALTNIDGLAALTSVGENLSIVSNNALMRCCGLYPLLTSGTIGGGIYIHDNIAGCNSPDAIVRKK